MKKKQLLYATTIVGAVTALTLVLILTITRSRSSVMPGSVNDFAPLAKGAVPSTQEGPREAIKVHGHWTIDVRNPDGTLVTHREFENALTSEGSTTLGRLLVRQQTSGGWLVRLENRNGDDACEELTPILRSRPCSIVEPGWPADENPNLKKSLGISLAPSGAIVLTGITTAARGA